MLLEHEYAQRNSKAQAPNTLMNTLFTQKERKAKTPRECSGHSVYLVLGSQNLFFVNTQ